jgi:hypothetical protein
MANRRGFKPGATAILLRIAPLIGVVALPAALAQHPHQHDSAPPAAPAAQPPHPAPHRAHVAPAQLAGIPHARDASGTAWQPEATPMHAHASRHAPRDWQLMAHYNVFAAYTRQSGPRGADQFNSTNWAMLMASRRGRDDELMLRGMFSLEPWTTTARGYPLLFQSGEAYRGRPLVDRQHPHDFFMEVAGRYRRILDDNTILSAYVAPAGEPALGPPAFPHRLSAMDNPAAPLGHHWMDSTHIAFGVLTAGVARGRWQVEGSWFNGREPDEDRWGIDLAPLDSYAGRLSWNPSPQWSAQVSIGYLESPEELHPEDDLWRTTASLIHTAPIGRNGHMATTLAWGRNDIHGARTHALLLESSLHRGSWTTFGRAEYVQKPGRDLELEPHDRRFAVRQLTLGASYELVHGRAWQLALGGSATWSFAPRDLDATYGRRPAGYWIFLRLRPAAMDH